MAEMLFRVWKPEDGRWVVVDPDGVLYDVRGEEVSTTGHDQLSSRDVSSVLRVVRRFDSLYPAGASDEAGWSVGATAVVEGDT